MEQAYITLGISIVGAIAWAIRLEGRVNTVEKVTELKHTDLKELINTKFDSISSRLERIERALNGALLKHD